MTKEDVAMHPGLYVKEHIIRDGLSVTAVAEILGVSRPTLSNLLNEKASLSPEMATRLEKTFGASSKQLLDLQTAFEGQQQAAKQPPVVPRTYVPKVVEISAMQIENWAKQRIAARSQLAALLRLLVNSTTSDVREIDFPAYDNAERRGWDGFIDATSSTAWIPTGLSGWEFGCNRDPLRKANNDYENRIKSTSVNERATMTYIFVTTSNWPGKTSWVADKRSKGQWMDVRAYDASDLEQWIGVSAPAQIWMSERFGTPVHGYRSLNMCWEDWAYECDPCLDRSLFEPAIEGIRVKFARWLDSNANKPFLITANSQLEGLAFLHCLMTDEKVRCVHNADDTIVFDCLDALSKMASAGDGAFVIVSASSAVSQSLTKFFQRFRCIIVCSKNQVYDKPDVTLDRLSRQEFESALRSMGGVEHDEVQRLARESGRLPTILRRRLSNNPMVKKPKWAENRSIVDALVPATLIGSWCADVDADRQVIQYIHGSKSSDVYHTIEREIRQVVDMEDTPMWSVENYRGVTSKIDVLFIISSAITKEHFDNFFSIAEFILSEADPTLELPGGMQFMTNMVGQSREYSQDMRSGICETLILLAVHGNALFRTHGRGVIQGRVETLVKALLSHPTRERLHSNNRELAKYAEAAPGVFLEILEEDLQSEKSAFSELLKPTYPFWFGEGCPQASLLWALECLAWTKELLPRVTRVLMVLSREKISDQWTNKPIETLKSIYRSWMPQTKASVDERIKIVESFVTKHPNVVWNLCLDQINTGRRFGEPNYRPLWRSDASGAGQPVIDRMEEAKFVHRSIEICLDWRRHDEQTLGDLIQRYHDLSVLSRIHNATYSERVWELIRNWVATEPSPEAKATLSKRIRSYFFGRSSRARSLFAADSNSARVALSLLASDDLTILHGWMFETPWMDDGSEELGDGEFDHRTIDRRTVDKRTKALREILEKYELEGIHKLITPSGANFDIGKLMFGLLETTEEKIEFVTDCLRKAIDEQEKAYQSCLSGFFVKCAGDEILSFVAMNIQVNVSDEEFALLLVCMPFHRSTWNLVESSSKSIYERYWSRVSQFVLPSGIDDVNYVIDKFIDANRPLAALQAISHSLKDSKSDRLVRILESVAKQSSNSEPSSHIDRYTVVEIFKALDHRGETSSEWMAHLEFMHFEMLEDSEYGVPNLELKLATSPNLYFQAICITYNRNDEASPAEEAHLRQLAKNDDAVIRTHQLLKRLTRIPGTNKNGEICFDELRAWVLEVRELCQKNARADIGDVMIGELLSKSLQDEAVEPIPTSVCMVLDEIPSKHIEDGFFVGARNLCGAIWRREGGMQELEFAADFRNLAHEVSDEYVVAGRLLRRIAKSYENDARWQYTEAEVRHSLRE